MYKTVSNISPYYLSKSLDLSEPKGKCLRSQHSLNTPSTFKKAGEKILSFVFPYLILYYFQFYIISL